MSKLNVDQKSVMQLFEDKKADFLIPDYQRPYAWQENECQTLWDDVFSFAFPDDDCTKFDSDNNEYFLGAIVTYKNEGGKMEVIDGQQRLTTLMLLLRAFYDYFKNMQDENSKKIKQNIEKCIWRTDEFGNANFSVLKIDSEVATDKDKEEFLNILRTGAATKEQKSNYASNFRFFQEKIRGFVIKYPTYCALLPIRILNNCILLPIEAESQDTALRIFSTLNDRGLQLSDADIFKAQFYKYYSDKGQKEDFIKKWKDLESLCEKIFHPISGTPMDELFTRYMYYERAKKKIKLSTTEALRKFYEKDSYKLLKNDETFENLRVLADFWNDVYVQDKDRFSDRVLRRLFVLNYAPNGMWTYIVSVYFMKNKDANGLLDDDAFFAFLNRITAFIWAYAITHPGVNALRTPVYAEMVNIIEGKPVEFANFKFSIPTVRSMFDNFSFNNSRPVTKSMLAWWAYHDDTQPLLSLDTVFEIEHIYARNRLGKDKSLKNEKNLEVLGNKALLETRINVRATDYRFSDKKLIYQGNTKAGNQVKDATKIQELLDLAKNNTDFTEADIEQRNKDILDGFMDYLKDNDLAL